MKPSGISKIKNSILRCACVFILAPFAVVVFLIISVLIITDKILQAIESAFKYELKGAACQLVGVIKYAWLGHEKYHEIERNKTKRKISV